MRSNGVVRFSTRLAAAATAVAAVLLAPALAATPQKGGTIVVALPNPIVAADPAFSYGFVTNPVVTNMAEGLLKFGPGEQVEPNLASSVDHPDALTYIYHLRTDVTFWDGTPMTADDVVFSMQRYMDPKTASYVAWMYGSVKSIEKVDASTVKVTLSKPDALWQYVPATTAGDVIEKAYFEAHKDNFGKPGGGLMATGPFELAKWSQGQEIVLKRNPHYWDASSGGPYLDEIDYKIIPESTTSVVGLKTGEVGAMFNVPVNLISVIQKMSNVQLQLASSYFVDAIAFNTQHKPFDDVKVRQALYYAFNEAQFIKSVIKDAGDAAKATPVPPALWVFEKAAWSAAWDKIPDYSYDLAKAKALLAQSSVPNGFTATMETDSNNVRLNSALTLQAGAKAIGITLNINKVPGKQLETDFFNGKRPYDIIIDAWSTDFPDPAGNLQPVFASQYAGDGGSNIANYKNPTLDKLLSEQNALSDPAARTALMIQAQDVITHDVPWINTDYPKVIFVMGKKYAGYQIQPLWYWDAWAKDVYTVK